jgi:hypothetical protein
MLFQNKQKFWSNFLFPKRAILSQNWYTYSHPVSSFAEQHNFDGAPDPDKNVDAALAPTLQTVLRSRINFMRLRLRVKILMRLRRLWLLPFCITR